MNLVGDSEKEAKDDDETDSDNEISRAPSWIGLEAARELTS